MAVAVSATTTLLTPWLIRASGPVANWVDRKLPRPLQTFAALYGSWLEELRSAPRRNTATANVRRLLRLLVIDAAMIAVLIVGTSTWMGEIVAIARQRAGISPIVARTLVIVGAIALAAPFVIGVIRVSQKLGLTLARMALPAGRKRRVDFAVAPRRTLVVTLQLASVLLVGMPLLALSQPFLSGVQGAIVLALAIVLLGVAFWRRATNLQGHVRAGAQVVLEKLTTLSLRSGTPAEAGEYTLADVQQVLPGLGALTAIRLEPGAAAIGQTLAQLNLRGSTGATVLAVTRREGGVIVPTAQERLQAADVLALAGTHDAIAAAEAVLRKPVDVPT